MGGGEGVFSRRSSERAGVSSRARPTSHVFNAEALECS